MEDYPRDLTEFEARFATEEACRHYLFRLRWPDGFRCPRCGGEKYWPLRGVLRKCAACGHQASVTAGTIFQDTRSPAALVVSGYVVGGRTEERRQRLGSATGPGSEEL